MLLNILYFIQQISSSGLNTIKGIKIEKDTVVNPNYCNDTGTNLDTGADNETGTNTETDNLKEAILWTNYEYNNRNLEIIKHLVFETIIWPVFVRSYYKNDILSYNPEYRIDVLCYYFKNTMIDCFRNLNLNINFKTLNDYHNFDEESEICENNCFLCFAISENDVDNNAIKFFCSKKIYDTLKKNMETYNVFKNKELIKEKYCKDNMNLLFRLNIDCKCKKNVENKFFLGFYISSYIIKDMFNPYTDLIDILEYFKYLKKINSLADRKDLQLKFLKKSYTLFSRKKERNDVNYFKNTLIYIEKIFDIAKQTETQNKEFHLDFLNIIDSENENLSKCQNAQMTPLEAQIIEIEINSTQNQDQFKHQSETHKNFFSGIINEGNENQTDKEISNQTVYDKFHDVKKILNTSLLDLFIDNNFDKNSETFVIFEKVLRLITNIKNFQFDFLIITPKFANILQDFPGKFTEFKTKKNGVFSFFLNDLLFEIVDEKSKNSCLPNYIENMKFMKLKYVEAIKLINCDPLILKKRCFSLQKETDISFFYDNNSIIELKINEHVYKVSHVINKEYFNFIKYYDQQSIFSQKLEFKQIKTKLNDLNYEKDTEDIIKSINRVFKEKNFVFSYCLIQNCDFCALNLETLNCSNAKEKKFR